MAVARVAHRNKPRYYLSSIVCVFRYHKLDKSNNDTKRIDFKPPTYFIDFSHSTGLGFRPLPPEDNVESTLIWYRGTNKENFEVWTDALDEFLSRKFYHSLPFLPPRCTWHESYF